MNNNSNGEDKDFKKIDETKEEINYTNNSNEPKGYTVEPVRKKKRSIIIPIFLGIIAILLLINILFMAFGKVASRNGELITVSEIIPFVQGDVMVEEVTENISKSANNVVGNYNSSQEYSQQLIGGISKIEVDSISADIEIISGDNNNVGLNVLVEIYSKSKNEYSIEKNGDKLRISSKKDKISMNFSFNENLEDKIMIYIPKENLQKIEKIDIVNISGDTRIYTSEFFKEIDIKTTSGNIDMIDISVGDLEIKTISGDISLHQVYSNEELDIKTTSGEITLEGVSALEQIDINTTSGDVGINGMSTEDFEVKTVSGLVVGEQIEVKKIKIESVSGDFDLQFDKSLSKLKGEVKTVSGGVEFYLPNGFPINVIGKNNSGKVSNPGNTENEIKIETVSGEMYIGYN